MTREEGSEGRAVGQGLQSFRLWGDWNVDVQAAYQVLSPKRTAGGYLLGGSWHVGRAGAET